MPTQHTPSRPARAKLLDAAARLFYAEGISATGIEAIIREAGVAKMSLYNNFDSKDALVTAYLEYRHEEWMQLYAARLSDSASPRARVLAVFDAYRDHANDAYEHGFRGCGLLNAAAELPANAPGRDQVRTHKQFVEEELQRHLLAMSNADTANADTLSPDTASALARHLSFLLEGAITRAGLESNDNALFDARAIAEMLLDQAAVPSKAASASSGAPTDTVSTPQ